jgi:hypothetical protein
VDAKDVFFLTHITLCDLLKMQMDLKLSGQDLTTLLDIITPTVQSGKKDDTKSVELAHFYALLCTGEDHSTEVVTFLALYPMVVDFLKQYKDILFRGENVLNLTDLFVVIPRLQPRFYSISSSSIHSPSKITITVGVLNTETSMGVKINGIC